MRSEVVKSFKFYYEKQKKIKFLKLVFIIVPIIVMLLALAIQNPSLFGAPEGSDPAPFIVSIIIFSLGALLGVVGFFDLKKIEWNIENGMIVIYTNQMRISLDNQMHLINYDEIKRIAIKPIKEKAKTPIGSLPITRKYVIIELLDTSQIFYLVENFPDSLEFISHYKPVESKIQIEIKK